MSHAKGPPPEDRIRARDAQRWQPPGRDVTPAVGHRGQAGGWRRAVEGARVALLKPGFEDGRWSFLYKADTAYAVRDGDGSLDGEVRDAARLMRDGDEVPVEVHGPMINQAVWTWQVPVYFWLGGIATGSAFAAVAADAAGDRNAARVARLVSLGAVLPGAPLLVLDLGRPLRFFNMLRIFKLRSPMSMGSWCLMSFTTSMGGAVVADLVAADRMGRTLGRVAAAFATYLGSYTGVLLASTAVPVWGRSRAFLAPIFICTGAATGAATTRLVLSALGYPPGHPSRSALGTVETAAMSAELVLSEINERRLGSLGHALKAGRPGKQFTFARGAVIAGLSLRIARRRGGTYTHHLASLLYLAAGLAYRFAWVGAGRTSAHDDEAVARMSRRTARLLGRERA